MIVNRWKSSESSLQIFNFVMVFDHTPMSKLLTSFKKSHNLSLSVLNNIIPDDAIFNT